MPDFKTILVATDFSDAALPGVQTAAALAAQLGSRLILLYVVEDRLPAMVIGSSLLDLDKIVDEHRARAGESLGRYAGQHLAGLPVETAVRTGTPHDEIVECARELGADLIVLATHGHGLVRHVIGSTAERVLHHAPCPVMVVRSNTES